MVYIYFQSWTYYCRVQKAITPPPKKKKKKKKKTPPPKKKKKKKNNNGSLKVAIFFHLPLNPESNGPLRNNDFLRSVCLCSGIAQ